METVTQKYLRNEYATIEAYNAVAGEVAEPYRVLVVADFPTKFDEKSAGRLAAIAAGGVPCGVLVLVAADTTKAHALGLPARRPSALLRSPDLARRPADRGTIPTSVASRWSWTRRRRPSSPPGRSTRSARRPATPSASRFPSSSSLRPRTAGGPATAARESMSRWARRARPSDSTWRWAREPASTC